ncbi:YDR336W [Zygosaccharomyces parabailii]|nr:YDR336W [Zygosaccharomyces parabailii]CDH13023.1 uncharacterized protein ZBAI_04809 [Zygosaccharomyces bailii ISA1307]
MRLTCQRGLSISKLLKNQTIDVKKIILSTNYEQANPTISPKNSRPAKPASKTKKYTKKPTPVWYGLNEMYNASYAKPSASELNSLNRFFNSSKVQYEWSAAQFADVPGEKIKDKLNTDGTSNKKFHGKTYVPFELVNGLPEVAFLGKSNAGKSTLLNSLTTDLKQTELGEYAKASKRAGFTKTLNSFNVGKKLRIVDTPGYGFNSSVEQGDLTMQYVQQRQQLVRCFLLISGEQNIGEMDYQVIEFLSRQGIPFEIVFTKMDKVTNFEKFILSTRDMKLSNLPGLPGIIFTNSVTGKNCPKRYGIDLLRHLIFQCCGLGQDSIPSHNGNT